MTEQEVSLKIKLDASDIQTTNEQNVTVNTPVAFRCPGADLRLRVEDQPLAIRTNL